MALPRAVRNRLRGAAAVSAGCSLLAAFGWGGAAALASQPTAHAASATSQTEAWVKRNAPGLSASVVQQACKEGKAEIYVPSMANVPGYVSGIEKALPCLSVSDYSGPGGVLASRFTTETQSKKYNADVIMNTSPVFLSSMIKKGYITRFTPPTAKLVPAAFTDPGYWYSAPVTELAIAWNSSAVSSQQAKELGNIKTWHDVLKVTGLNPGQMGIIDIASGGSDELPWYYFQHAYGTSFMTKFASQFKPEVYASIITAAGRLASGGTPVVFGAVDGVVGGYITKGAQIKYVYPKPYLATPFGTALPTHAPHPAAAKLIETWILSKVGQAQMLTDNYSDPMSSAIKDTRPYAKDSWFKPAPVSGAYPANWLNIQNALPALTKKFTSAFGASQS
jgi:iron(III) transport system substrate-binding protein